MGKRASGSLVVALVARPSIRKGRDKFIEPEPSERVFEIVAHALGAALEGDLLRCKPRNAASIGSIALAMTITRYRCDGCGNLTRFDVAISRRTREFHHFTVGGDVEIESIEVVEEEIESVQCRWCGAQGDRIQVLAPDTANDRGN